MFTIQDRDGAALVLDKRTRAMFPFITKVFADGGYQGERVAALLRDTGTWTLDIVKRSDAGKGFHVLPKRWIVEPNAGVDLPLTSSRPQPRKPAQILPRPDPARHDQAHGPQAHTAIKFLDGL